MSRSAAAAPLRFVFIAFFALLLSFAAVARDAAGPALWKIEGPEGTVYLFGSFHLLKGGEPWYGGQVQAAFEDATSLTLELGPDQQAPAVIGPLVHRYGLYGPTDALKNHISEASYRELIAVAADSGVPEQVIANMRPWLATLTVSLQFALAQGFDPEQGVEATLLRHAGLRELPVSGLETAEEQIRFLAENPPETEQAFVDDTLRQLDELPRLFDELSAAWLGGDEAALNRLMVASMAGVPEVYETLLVERNRRWVPRIEALLSKPGVHFVAVGAGHLVGPDSVIKMLAARGIAAER